MLRTLLKQMVMWGAYGALGLWGRLARRPLAEPARVGILFLPPLGLGDLIMLSPAIQAVQRRFARSEVYLVTRHPDFIAFEGITPVGPEALRAAPWRLDLVISPALALGHLRYLPAARQWAGYFARPVLQSNCLSAAGVRYDPRNEHYVWRGIRLLRALAPEEGERLADAARQRALSYPALRAERPALYDERLRGRRFMVLNVLSRFRDGQWPMERVVEVARRALDEGLVDTVVIAGDRSRREMAWAASLAGALDGSPCIDAAGRLSLPELAWLVQESELFLGLDSGPAHLAALLARRAVVLYVTVPPELRRPLMRLAPRRFEPVYPDPPPQRPLYGGFRPVRARTAQAYMERISVSRVLQAAGL